MRSTLRQWKARKHIQNGLSLVKVVCLLAVLNVILLYAYYSVRHQRFQVENGEMWKFIRDLVNFAMMLS